MGVALCTTPISRFLMKEVYLEGGRVIHCAMRVEGNALLRIYLFSERVAVPPIGIEPMTL
jgi:hypothetical protein